MRYLQKLFEKDGTSFTDHLVEHRLGVARILLQSHRGSVEIAMPVGYNDLSNCHRSFKRRFGETPAAMPKR